MFTPKSAKTQSSSGGDLTGLLAHKGSTVKADAMQWAPRVSAAAHEAEPRASWNFSKVPLFQTDREGHVEGRSLFHGTRLPGVIQTKLVVNEPGDEYEQEADQVADQVMRMPAQRVSPHAHSKPGVQRQCACGSTCRTCREASTVRPHPTAPRAAETGVASRRIDAPPSVHRVLRAPGQALDRSARAFMEPRLGRDFSHIRVHTDAEAAESAHAGEAPASVHEVLRSPGQPLDAATRAYFEPRFGSHFSAVRVHTGTLAAQSARDVNAHAYAVGQSIVFDAGLFAPGTDEGKRLIAHELAHVVQQSGVDAIRADPGYDKRGLSPFPFQQQVTPRPHLVCRAPADPKQTSPGASLPSKSENQARLAELMDEWVPSLEKQRLTTISRAAAIEETTGRRVYLIAIAGEGARSPLHPSVLLPDEVLVPYAGGHAEIQTMHFAQKNGYKVLPGALEPSRAFCTNCAFWARKEGLAPPHAKVRVGQQEKPLAEVSNRELTKNLGEYEMPRSRGEPTAKGKAKRAKLKLKGKSTITTGELTAVDKSVAPAAGKLAGEASVIVDEAALRNLPKPEVAPEGLPASGMAMGEFAAMFEFALWNLVLPFLLDWMEEGLEADRRAAIKNVLQAAIPEIQGELIRHGVGREPRGEFAGILQQTKGGRVIYANVSCKIELEAPPALRFYLVNLKLSTTNISKYDGDDHYVFSFPVYSPNALATELLGHVPEAV